MPLDERNVPLPPDNDGNEDILASQSSIRYSPLPPDPPGREDIMTPEPRDSRAPR